MLSGNLLPMMVAMLKKTYPYYLANEPQWPNADLVVLD